MIFTRTKVNLLRAVRIGGFLAVCLLGIFDTALAEIDPAERLQVQARVEDEIVKLLRTQLAPEEFFVVVDVDVEDSDKSPQVDKAEGEAVSTLPYLTLKIDPQKLRNSAGSGPESQFKIKALRAEVTFDARISEEKRKILEASIRRKLKVDDNLRTLQVGTASLVTESIAEQLKAARVLAKAEADRPAAAGGASTAMTDKERFDLEAERIKLEVAKKDLEIQRNRLEQTRELSSIESKVKDLEAKLRFAEAAVTDEKKKAEQASAKAAEEKSAAVASSAMDDGGFLAGIAKIQLVLVGGIIGAAMFLGLFLGSGAFKKGMAALAEGFSKIGTAVKEAAVAAIEAQKERDKAGKRADAGLASSEDGEKRAVEQRGEAPAAAASAQPPGTLSEAERVRFEEFLASVQDKIEILAKERSFALYREIQDFVESEQSLPMAAALLLCLSRDSTIELMKGLSTTHIERLKRYLARPGAMQESKALRNSALQEFYGRIVVEEFAGSPMLKLKDAAWLLQLSNSRLAKLAAELPSALRPAFLSCFSPVRVKKMVEAAGDETTKKLIVGAAVDLGASKAEDVEKLLVELAKLKEKTNSPAEAGGLVDRARYLSRLAESLGDEDQKLLLAEIGRKNDVQQDFARYYVPFNVIEKMPKDIIMEIFGDRPDDQVALMIFASEESVRQAVLKALPEIRAATVGDELKLLDSKTFYKKRNEKQSFALQRQVSAYLLRLKEEGLLDQVNPNLRVMDGAA